MKLGMTLPLYINNSDHLYFTKQTLESITTDHEIDICLVVNHINPELDTAVASMIIEVDSGLTDKRIKHKILSISNPYGNCVAGGWTTGVKELFDRGCDFVMIPNNDIVFHPQCIDNLIKFYEENKEDHLLWSALTHDNLRTIKSVVPGEGHDEHPGFSLFAVSKESIEKLRKFEEGTAEPIPGFFDPGFVGAYFEDQDFHQRILRAGMVAGKTATALYYHFGSRTIKTDEQLNIKNFHQYEDNRKYFAKKWGYDAHGRGFSNEERLQFGYKTPFNK